MNKSENPVLSLEEIIIPFKVVFPVLVEGSVNNDFFSFPPNKEVSLTYPQYENLRHSSYEKYLNQ